MNHLPIPMSDGRIAVIPIPLPEDDLQLLLDTLSLWRKRLTRTPSPEPPARPAPGSLEEFLLVTLTQSDRPRSPDFLYTKALQALGEETAAFTSSALIGLIADRAVSRSPEGLFSLAARHQPHAK